MLEKLSTVECMAFSFFLFYFLFFESLTFFLSLTFRRVCVNKSQGCFMSGCANLVEK